MGRREPTREEAEALTFGYYQVFGDREAAKAA
jgi:hypothetical protein